jgi:hypothetical protein
MRHDCKPSLYRYMLYFPSFKKKVNHARRSLISRLSLCLSPFFLIRLSFLPNIRTDKAPCLGTADGAIYEVELEYGP